MDTPAQTSETPRTERASNRPEAFDAWELVVPVAFARQLERELNDAYKALAVLQPGLQHTQEQLANAEAKLTAVLTDKDYEGGVQYWIHKHDELALILARLQSAESGHRAVRDAAAS